MAKDGKLNDLKINGEPVDPAKTYRMATLSFNATGGDGYPRIDNKPGYVNTGFIDAEVLKEYVQKNSPLMSVRLSRRVKLAGNNRAILFAILNAGSARTKLTEF